MKNKNGLIAFALLGLVAGTAAYYLLATEDGKDKLKKANSGIKDLTKSIKSLAKKEAKKANSCLSKTQKDVEKLVSKTKEAGQTILADAVENIRKTPQA